MAVFAHPLWLDDYLGRIDWSGPAVDRDMADREDARATLAALVACHAATIPFENIDCLLHEGVDVDPDVVLSKLIDRRRGGYCFEQNTLFQMVLEAFGYRVRPVLARVLWANPEPSEVPRSHMALIVSLSEGDVLVDVGFGGNVLTGVLDFADGAVQSTPNGLFKLDRQGDGWLQSVQIDGEWRPTYLLGMETQYPVDFAVANWWVATQPASHFRHMLSVALALPDRRLALRNHHFSVIHNDGRKEQVVLADAQAVLDCLSSHLGIVMPDARQRAALVARLNDIAAQASAT